MEYLSRIERRLLMATHYSEVAQRYADFVRAEVRALLSGEELELSREESVALRRDVVYSAVGLKGAAVRRSVDLKDLAYRLDYELADLEELLEEWEREELLVGGGVS